MPAAKLTTTALRRRVVRLWNVGDKTQADIAALLGLTRGVVGRLIAEARAMGMPTIRYSTQETAERAQASYRARVGEAAFTERMAPHVGSQDPASQQGPGNHTSAAWSGLNASTILDGPRGGCIDRRMWLLYAHTLLTHEIDSAQNFSNCF